MKRKTYDYLTILKNHSEIFTYDVHNDIYHCEMYSMSIGNKRSLQSLIEGFCKSNKKVENLFKDFTANELLSANYNEDKSRWLILPIATAFEAKNILKKIEEEKNIVKEDKYIAGTIEAGYDNYLSIEEEVDLAEAKSIGKKTKEEIEME